MAKPWFKQVRYWWLFGVVTLLVAFRIAMIPLARHYTQKGLDSMKGFRGSFADIDISLPRLSYQIEGLKIIEEPVKPGKAPFFYTKKIDAHFMWRELIRFHIRATARIEDAKVLDTGELPGAHLDETLQKLVPFKLDRIEVKNGELLFVDKREKDRPVIWVHRIEATIENFASRKDLARNEPATLALRGIFQKSGQLDVFVAADPFAKGLTFAGEVRLKGTFEMFASFKCVDGMISGGVRANAVATIIPIHGRIDKPDMQVWPAVLGVVRNSFVEALPAKKD